MSLLKLPKCPKCGDVVRFEVLNAGSPYGQAEGWVICSHCGWSARNTIDVLNQVLPMPEVEQQVMRMHDFEEAAATSAGASEVWPEGRKDDQGKMRWGLVPFDAVGGIVHVLDFGAKKYSDRNWEQGVDWQRCFDALMRHLTAWWAREPADPETGFSHLWHAGCCILFLIAYEMRGVGKDTRPLAKRQKTTLELAREALDKRVADKFAAERQASVQAAVEKTVAPHN